jgi:hypothetical protein
MIMKNILMVLVTSGILFAGCRAKKPAQDTTPRRPYVYTGQKKDVDGVDALLFDHPIEHSFPTTSSENGRCYIIYDRRNKCLLSIDQKTYPDIENFLQEDAVATGDGELHFPCVYLSATIIDPLTLFTPETLTSIMNTFGIEAGTLNEYKWGNAMSIKRYPDYGAALPQIAVDLQLNTNSMSVKPGTQRQNSFYYRQSSPSGNGGGRPIGHP